MNQLNNINAILQGPTSLNAQLADIKMAPPDPILGTNVAFQKDKSEDKIHLGVGAYRDSNGKPYVFNIIKKIESSLHNKVLNHVLFHLFRNTCLLMDILISSREPKSLFLDKETRLLRVEELSAHKLSQALELSVLEWKSLANFCPELSMSPSQLGQTITELYKRLVFL